MQKQYYIYIMSNQINSVLYTGVTNNLIRRAYEHRNKLVDGFTRKYRITKLVYFEIYDEPEAAILREKQIKGGSRQDKINLIMKQNPNFNDLYDQLI